MLGLSPELRCVDNRGISSRYQPGIATVIHITAYDLTNCTRSEPFVASLCGGLWSAFTPHLRQGPTSRHCPEIATAPVGSSSPASHGTRLRPVGFLCSQGFRRPTATGYDKGRAGQAPRLAPGTRCPPHVWANRYRSAKQQAHRTPANARLAPFANPRTPFTARIRRAPSSRYCLEIATAPATFSRPGPSPRHGTHARPLGATSSRDLAGPALTRALGPGTGKSGGGPSALATPPRSRSRAPAASRPPGLSQGPMVASPPRNCHSTSRVCQTLGPALGTAPTRGPWGLRARGT